MMALPKTLDAVSGLSMRGDLIRNSAGDQRPGHLDAAAHYIGGSNWITARPDHIHPRLDQPGAAADLFVIDVDIRQHLLFDIGIAEWAKDIDNAELVSGRAEEGCPRIERLNDISGKRRRFERRHFQFRLLPSRICGGLKLRLLLGLIKAPLSTENRCSPVGWVLIQCG
jgi:hypothetical protein